MSNKTKLGTVEYNVVLNTDSTNVIGFSEVLVIHQGKQNVLVNHGDLDGLIGRLMQMCELNGDREQRDALKRSIKDIAREWLRDQYASAGSGLYGELDENARIYGLREMSREDLDEPQVKK